MKFISFNIRYVNDIDGHNCWQNRRDLIVQFIQSQKPIAFGVQEAWDEQMVYLDQNLPEYHWVGVGREDGKRQGEYCGIFYDPNRLKLLESQTRWLSETPEIPGSVSWDSCLCRIMSQALFQQIATGKKFLFMDTHFDHEGHVARQESAKRINQWVKVFKDMPVIVCGDFNCEPDSPEYHELAAGTIVQDARTIAEETFGSNTTFHGFHDEFDIQIDYFFVNQHVHVLQHATYAVEPADGVYLSDHHPIGVEVTI